MIKKWREWWQGSGERGYHIFEIDDFGRNVREIAYYQHKGEGEYPEDLSRIISHMVMVHNDRVDEALTPISSEKDENAQPFQCPEGLTCSGDGWDCIGDGLCEKDGNADGVEERARECARCIQAMAVERPILFSNIDALTEWFKTVLHHEQTPPAAGWQIPDGEDLPERYNKEIHTIVEREHYGQQVQALFKIIDLAEDALSAAPKPDETSKGRDE